MAHESAAYALTGCNWELTLGCTLHCLHCGSSAGKARPNELSVDECLSVADELVALGCKDLTLIGGEVFRFRGWDRLSAYLTGNGIAVNIVTNGYRIGEAEIEQIKRAKVVNVGVSIDGMEANHNRMRGRRDAFQHVRNTFDLLNRAGIETGAVTSLTRFNCADLEDLYVLLLDKGVRIWQLQLVVAMGNMAKRSDVVVSPAQVREVIEFIRDKASERRMAVIAADSIGYFDDNESYIRGNSSPICFWGGCGAGTSSVFIDSVGNVKGCGALYSDVFIEGNVRERSLADIWNASDGFAYNRKFTTDLLSGVCQGCTVGEACRGGCRSANYFSTGSLYSGAFCCRPRRTRPQP